MNKVEYDVIKLKQFGDIDVQNAIKNFSSYQKYFDELNKFVCEAKDYLHGHLPSVVIMDAESRKSFQAEVKRIKSNLMKLGIAYPMPTLSEINYEASGGSEKILTELLSKFDIEIFNMIKKINQSQIVDESSAPGKSDGQSKTIILAVDDKPELLTPVVNMLEDRFKVMAATSGKAALKAIEKHTPELFILDIEMPQMNGYELAELIRKKEKYEHTPIIFLTSQNTREDVISAIKSGGSDYILKPVDKDLLLSKILRHLGVI